jgi:hypothetical protein
LQVERSGRGRSNIAGARSKNAARELALTTRTLLEDLGIIDGSRLDEVAAKNESSSSTSNIVRKETGKTESPSITEEKSKEATEEPRPLVLDQFNTKSIGRRNRIRLGFKAAIAGELYGSTGTFFQAGGASSISWSPIELFFVRVLIGVMAGPFNQEKFQLLGWSLEPGFELGFSFHLGPLNMGPVVGVLATRNSVSIDYGNQEQEFSWWRVKATVGAALLWPLNEMFGLTLDAGLGWYLGNRETFAESEVDALVYSWPFAIWNTGLGVVFKLN